MSVAPFGFGSRLVAQESESSIQVTRTALTKWVEAKKTISAEREAWRQGKQTLTSQIDVVKRQIESLNKRIEEARKSIAEADEKYGELEKEHKDRKEVSAKLAERIATLEERTLKLLPRVPQALATKVEPISQRLPGAKGEPQEGQPKELSLSIRYQNVIGVLNGIDKWNRGVTLANERRDLGTGRSVTVSVLYIGLGQAYYCGGIGKDGRATLGGVGLASPNGWIWREANSLAEPIQRAVGIYNNEGLAEIVRLPVQIR